MKLAIVGVTGLVGRKMLEILEKKDIKVEALFPVASEKSTGKRILFKNKEYTVISIHELIDKKPEIALLIISSSVSLIKITTEVESSFASTSLSADCTAEFQPAMIKCP